MIKDNQDPSYSIIYTQLIFLVLIDYQIIFNFVPDLISWMLFRV